jgi:hypothetical protein
MDFFGHPYNGHFLGLTSILVEILKWNMKNKLKGLNLLKIYELIFQHWKKNLKWSFLKVFDHKYVIN